MTLMSDFRLAILTQQKLPFADTPFTKPNIIKHLPHSKTNSMNISLI